VHVRVTPLSGRFGTELRRIEFFRDMSDGVMRSLIALPHDHQILAIVGQELGNPDYVRCSRPAPPSVPRA
jgi:hypothetical protein